VRAVVQRVTRAQVTTAGQIVGSIGPGLVVLLGVEVGDTQEDAVYLADKIINLRIFADSAGKMNLSLLDRKGELLVVSQFTLIGDCRKGRRPSFVNAAPPEQAEPLYEEFVERVKSAGITVGTGRFRTEMTVEIHNQGPVTLILNSRREN